eukprot:TRINITY_DN2875_c0_g1_i1.p1 TRINITY_DN2875_c0_g1~~TRINITY_DN2875_c0_g1_i1.p1  ORF type:complete len:993 (-),score=314.75 TRINITY_DN2875_c0_g1_i1:114-3092(-)
MNRVYCIFLILLGSFCASLWAQETDGFSYVVSHLQRYQTRGGGFRLTERDSEPSLEATADALFLSSLYGLRQKINPNVAQYIHQLEKSEGHNGYGKTAGLASDIESVRNALLSYKQLGQTVIPNAGNVATYVKGLLDNKSSLFGSRANAEGDVKSTALAFQILEILNGLQNSWVTDLTPKIRAHLDKHKKDGNHFSFGGSSPLTDNYYGILLGSYVQYDFDFPKFAAFIASFQDAKTGGFFTTAARTATSLEATSHAVSSLYALQQLSNDGQFVSTINADKLFAYVSSIPRDLRSAALAHKSIAVTKNFVKNFNTAISYEVLGGSGFVEKGIVQGTQLKPVLTVTTFDELPHAGLDVEVRISYESSPEVATAKLHWRDNQKYSSNDFIDTESQLGTVTFTYVVRVVALGVGEINFEITDVQKVGYGITVDSRAVLDVTGKEFQPGETVAIGTSFKFAIALNNHTNEEFYSGNFNVIFTVLDSSLVAIHSDKLNGATNTGSIQFQYTLQSSNIPSGALYFRFEVANSNGVHTTETVEYQLAIRMIATHITFEGVTGAATYKIGDTVKVSIEPASFPDLRNTFTYDVKDITGASVVDNRKFFLDIKSPGGVLLRSVAGKAAAAGTVSKYSFTVSVDASLDSIGANVVSFRYVAADGDSFELSNYDSVIDELYEDSNVLNYTVNADLYVTDIEEAPQNDAYFYGNDVSFKFAIKDAVSGKTVTRGNAEQANVYLSLKHKDENRPRGFVSAHEAASFVNGKYAILWAINPNAVQGDGDLSVAAQDADGNHLNLRKDAKSTQQVSYKVSIGGKIDVTENTYSTAKNNEDDTAFIVQFSLQCQDKNLKDAQLKASVVLENGKQGTTVLSGLPVATNDEGSYSVSWNLPHEQAPSGKYNIRFYREVDRKRALENREFKEKQQRREEELKRLTEGVTESSSVEQATGPIEDELEPLFTIQTSHNAPSTGKLPIRTEVLILVALGAAFFAISYQKKQYRLF